MAHNMVKSDTHCAFIDFSKAFDKIDKLILYNKMMKCDISSMMLQMIVNMYSKIRSKMKTSEGFTDAFPLDIGLLQVNVYRHRCFPFVLMILVHTCIL